MISSCGGQAPAVSSSAPAIATSAVAQSTPANTVSATANAPAKASNRSPLYQDAAAPVEKRVDDLLARMSLAEKIGQMTQVEKNSLTPNDVTRFGIGSVLSGGGGYPLSNTKDGWREMVGSFQEAALQTPLAIPLLYGVDAVHGHNNAYGATIFPHNIGLGATGDPELVERIAAATAEELKATGVNWNFAPVVAVPQDIRWGRTYEAYGDQTDLVAALGAASVRGLQNGILATPKHYIGDGGTAFGSATTNGYLLDQGDTQMDEATLRRLFLPPYEAAIDAGANSVMVSFSSWNGEKLHGSRYLLTDVLKDELDFAGFIVSDWQAIDQLPGDYYSDVITAINAGIDMVMVPYDYKNFIATLTQAVEMGDVPLARIDDAVQRILRVKFAQGIFEQPLPAEPGADAGLGAAAHRELAREAVRRSQVLLKNEDQTLPLAKDLPLIFVAGDAADDIGVQAGGWTLEWQGKTGDITPGTTILEGIRATVSPATRVEYNRYGKFDTVIDAAGNAAVADACIVVVGEEPYAEGKGDRADLALPSREARMIDRMSEQCRKTVVLLVSGRPLIVTDYLASWDALVASWLPGTEGQGV
ncbi:MAG: glycoside hydrolase family 3 protein, partial [Anaerolineales bacterium]|nr:glycoside hydrolase family 3 protein [Anaerolineales bacterium]